MQSQRAAEVQLGVRLSVHSRKGSRPGAILSPGRRAAGHVPGASASIVAAAAAALSLSSPSLAKTPGEFHCYNGICHRVKSVDEMTSLVGMEVEAVASFYDAAERDVMNAGTITSSGEEFDADSDSHAASAYYPDGTELLVWNPKTRRAAHVRVNDFGPFYSYRTLDVTRGVAEKLGFQKSGVAKLRIIVIWAPGHAEARFSRLRQYAAVGGYLGQVDADQITAIKYRLISTASGRNGYRPSPAAPDPEGPRLSLVSLPAYAAPAANTAATRKLVAILNAPRFVLTPAAAKGALKPTTAPPATVKSAQPALASVSATAVAEIASAREASDAEAGQLTVVAQSESTAKQQAASEAALQTQPTAMASIALPHPEEAPLLVARFLSSALLAWPPLAAAFALLMLATLGLWRHRAQSSRMRAAGLTTASARRGSAAEPIDLRHLREGPDTAALIALRDSAIACMERYAYADAETAYRKLLAAREAMLGVADPLCASAERQLADCLREQGRYSAAEPHYRRALATLTAATGEFYPMVADILDEYATAVLRQGYGGRAEVLARQSLAIRRSAQPNSREHALTLALVGETLRAQGHLVAAEIEHRTALTVLEAQTGPESLEVASSRLSLGAVLGELGRFPEAEDLLNQATRTLSSATGASHPATAHGYARLSDLYRRAGNLEQSLAMQRHAFAIRERTLGQRHPETIECLLALAQLAADQYRTDEARVLLDRALDALIGAERTHFGPQSRTRAALVALSHYFETARPLANAAE